MADLNLVGSYDYELPSELIASAPVMPKQSARLLIYDRAKEQITSAIWRMSCRPAILFLTTRE